MRANSKPTRGSGYYRRYLAQYTKKNYALLLLGGLFAFGAVLGALLVRSATGETLALLLRLVDGFMQKRREQAFAVNLWSATGTSLLMAGGLFVCGFCAISQPAVIAVPFFRGMGFGFSVGSLFARYGIAVFGYTGVLIVPGMVLSTVAILLCCRESLRLSGTLLRLLRGAQQNGQSGRGQYPLRLYVARYLCGVLLCAVSAVLEAALYAAFSHFFVF